jgi:hypothetical protein
MVLRQAPEPGFFRGARQSQRNGLRFGNFSLTFQNLIVY